MTQLSIYFFAVVAAVGFLCSIFMVRHVYQFFRERSIPRRTGNPITPDREPAVYWMLIGWMALGTVGAIYGTVATILKVLELIRSNG
jgi:hypothetical protein